MQNISFFLGANTVDGFTSLYEEYLAGADPARVWVLKGGAGCGKSGLLKAAARRAAQAGLAVYTIYCSGDPESLDGVHIPALGAAILDGTAPHVLEPQLVGQKGYYLDLSRFYQPASLALDSLDAAYKESYRRAYRYLAAAGAVDAAVPLPAEAAGAIRLRAQRLAAREFRRSETGQGRVTRFFTDAFTCAGTVTLPESRSALCSRLLSLSGAAGASALFLETLAEAALARNWDIVLCPDPLQPARPAHLLIPELDLGVVTSGGGRRLHLEKTVFAAMDPRDKAEYREASALRDALLAKAHEALQAAKASHDQLEAAVHPFIDFSGVTAFTERFTNQLIP